MGVGGSAALQVWKGGPSFLLLIQLRLPQQWVLLLCLLQMQLCASAPPCLHILQLQEAEGCIQVWLAGQLFPTWIGPQLLMGGWCLE